MACGRVPALGLSRTRAALLGALLLLVFGATPQQYLASIDVAVLVTLFALMLIGAQLHQAHAFRALTDRVASSPKSAPQLLAMVLASSALLSLVLVNDIVVFALAPLICDVCKSRQLNPKPYLIGMAFAANAGSAASLIGNPQNILLAEVGALQLLPYFTVAAVPALVCLIISYLVIYGYYRHHLQLSTPMELVVPPSDSRPSPAVNPLATCLALLALVGVVVGFIAAPAYGSWIALVIASLLTLISTTIAGVKPKPVLRRIDGRLLVLITGLFVITSAFSQLPEVGLWIRAAEHAQLLPSTVPNTTVFAVLASNTIGNVPAVMLLLNLVENIPTVTLQWLALLTTLSGNLLLTGSLANIITAERAARHGVQLTFGDFMRVGIPVTAVSLGFAMLWLQL